MDKYNWEGINFPSEKNDWKNFEKNNVIIALNVFYAKKGKNISCLSFKNNSNREKQIVLFMIPNGEKLWHYLAVKKPSALLRGTTSKNYGDFYCLNCLHSFRTKSKLESHKKVREKKDFGNVIMPSEDTKILEINQYKKSDKTPFINYSGLEWLIEKINGCKNNPEKSLTARVGEHIPSGFSVS